MSPRTPTRGRRLLAGATVAALTAGVLAISPTAAQAAAPAVSIEGGSISWGLKSSFRSYLLNGAAHGTLTPTAPATDNGTQTVFPQASGSWSDTTAEVGTKGSVRYSGHEGALDLTISDPRIVVTGSAAQLVVDAVDSNDVAHDDVAFASIDLTGAVSSDADSVTITQAPTTITAAGSALLSYGGTAFYDPGTALDAVSAQFDVAETPTPRVTVSKTEFFSDETATVTVTGSGFDPAAAIGAQPPFAGAPSGYYVVFGKFADTWRPSENAPSSSRKNTSQKWALPQASYDILQGFGGNSAAQGVVLNPDGTFTAEVTVSKAAIDAAATDPSLKNYGIYTYAGGGAKVAAAETVTPVTFNEPTVTVERTQFYNDERATVTVTGSGFNPASAIGTRPPFARQQSGVYIAFGRYADVWRPSAGAPPSARTNPSGENGNGAAVVWAVPAASFTASNPVQDPTSKNYTLLNADGTFTARITVDKSWLATASGNFGLYTYAGGGPTVAQYETYTPVSFVKRPTTVSIDAPAVTVGQSATVTATVAPGATGTVTLSGTGGDLTSAVVDGVATFEVADLAVGSYDLTASYAGDDDHAASEATATLTVGKIASAPLTTKGLTTKYAKGGTVTVTAPAAGTVTVAGLGSRTTGKAGSVSFSIPKRHGAGTKSYRVTFVPTDTNIAAPAATTVKVKIAKVAAAKPKVKVSKKPTSKKKGKAVVTVKGVSGGAATTGKVKVKLTKGKKSKVVTVGLSKGKRTVTLPKLTKGTWTVRVAYYGNANYGKRGYVKTGTVKVTK